MPKHYQLPEEKCIRCISEILPDFSMNLAPVFRARPEAKPSRFVCVFTKASLRVCLSGEGTETSAVWAGCSANTDSAWVIVRDREENERPARTANTPSCSERGSRMCVCACARVNALLPVHSCGQIQIWGHTLSQCALFNFHRYVNSNAKACIWCIRKVYPKGEES